MFECDVKLSADGVPFLMHDAALERTTNGVGTGGDQPWEQLARLDAGSWHSRAYAGEPLPTFENIARFCLANGSAPLRWVQNTNAEVGLSMSRTRCRTAGMRKNDRSSTSVIGSALSMHARSA